MNHLSRAAAIAVMGSLAFTAGCGEESAAPRTSISTTDVSSTPEGGMAHGNHDPKFGGVVLMNGKLHFEVVATNDGRYTLYFSDEARHELPATVVSAVKLGIGRPGFRAEPVDMKISDTGESWEGKGGYVDEPDASITVHYTYQGQPCTSDMPFIVAGSKTSASQKASTPQP